MAAPMSWAAFERSARASAEVGNHSAAVSARAHASRLLPVLARLERLQHAAGDGVTFTRAEIEKIGRVCEKHSLWIVSDEVYEDLAYARRLTADLGVRHEVVTLRPRDIGLSDVREAIRVSEATEYGDVINSVVSNRLFQRVHEAGIKVIHKCTSVRHSLKAEQIGCDAVDGEGVDG